MPAAMMNLQPEKQVESDSGELEAHHQLKRLADRVKSYSNAASGRVDRLSERSKAQLDKLKKEENAKTFSSGCSLVANVASTATDAIDKFSSGNRVKIAMVRPSWSICTTIT